MMLAGYLLYVERMHFERTDFRSILNSEKWNKMQTAGCNKCHRNLRERKDYICSNSERFERLNVDKAVYQSSDCTEECDY